MLGNDSKQKQELGKFRRLINLYAQSRSLSHFIPLTLALVNAFILVGAIELTDRLAVSLKVWWPVLILISAVIWSIFSTLWLTFRMWPQLKNHYYRRDGEIIIEKGKVHKGLEIIFIIAFLGVAIPGVMGVFPFRWAMTASLGILGFGLILEGEEEQTKVFYMMMIVMVWMEAAAVAAGALPALFPGKHSFFLSLVIYAAGAWLTALVLSHVFNRLILRKIKGMKLFEK